MSLHGPLTLRRCCELMQWIDDETRQPSELHMRRLRRRLRAEERASGERYLCGGGNRGNECWTTLRTLVQLRLLPENPILYGEAMEGLTKLHERLEEVDERMSMLAEAVFETQQSVKRLAGRAR